MNNYKNISFEHIYCYFIYNRENLQSRLNIKKHSLAKVHPKFQKRTGLRTKRKLNYRHETGIILSDWVRKGLKQRRQRRIVGDDPLHLRHPLECRKAPGQAKESSGFISFTECIKLHEWEMNILQVVAGKIIGLMKKALF